MSNKRMRQAALLRLTRERPFATQDEMVQRLRESGLESTQSSVSRDVRELGLIRVNGRYVPAATASAGRRADRLSGRDIELIIYAEPVGANLIVVKTPPGSANVVALDLDQRMVTDIAGTVAGDDTIFVAVRSRAAQGRVLALLPSVSGPPNAVESDASDGGRPMPPGEATSDQNGEFVS